MCILIDKPINLFLCQTSIKESANLTKLNMLLYDLSMLFVRFTLKCISNIHSNSNQSNHGTFWSLTEIVFRYNHCNESQR